MKCLILAGGGGNALWPLSRENLPKQFMNIKENRSLLQDTVARNMSFCDAFIVTTLLRYQDTVEAQMSAFQGLHYHTNYEAIPRKTTAAMVLTALSEDPDEILFVAASDHFIDGEGYKEAINRGRELVEQGHFVLFGVKPTAANTNYGYMQVYEEKILRFYERPSAALAQAFCELEDFLVNCSLCMFRVGDFLKEFQAVSPDIYEACVKAFALAKRTGPVREKEQDYLFDEACMQLIPSISFGEAFFTKARDLWAVPGNFHWQNIGLLEDAARFTHGEGKQLLSGCENVEVINTVKKSLVVANDVTDLIIVNTKDAVYVTKRDSQSNIKKILSKTDSAEYASYFQEDPEKKVPLEYREIVRLRPHIEERLWGGTRLMSEFGKELNHDLIAESWELSAHPAGESVIASGKYTGLTFTQYLDKLGKEAWGWKCSHLNRFPILVKLIDSADNLSVQVHPDDEYALIHENEYGKNEMWYICDAAPDAAVYCGLKEPMSEAEVRKHVQDQTITDYLKRVPVKKGDSIFVKAGTIHAIGGGITLCEIQQSSNITYRMYDFGRVDKDGKPRELHLDKALEAACLEGGEAIYQDFERLDKGDEFSEQIIGRCKYFECRKYDIHTAMKLQVDDASFVTMTVIEGNALVKGIYNQVELHKGDSAFIPAGGQNVMLEGECEVVLTRC
ncbi:MAG: hypothetical protein K6A92_06355 [Lachnospiraceae bacterium]|nr:hypothetical protein [Lachnospiraceae bacterium]